MSYYFAIWDGPAPLSNAHATSECERLLGSEARTPPSIGMLGLVDVLRAAHPDDAPSSPWSERPLVDHVDGTLAYLPVKPEQAEQIRPLLQDAAEARNFVAFDPQLGELMPSATTVPRVSDFELPEAADLPLHLTAVIGEALGAAAPMAGILEQMNTGYYVQWMATSGELTVEAQGETLLAPEHRLSREGRDQMVSLGFTEGDPNWQMHWSDGFLNLDQAGQILGHVLTAVRRMPVGTPMALQTFPI